MMQEQHSQHGYNLIDLALVAVVCGVVTSIAVPTYAAYRSNVRFAEVELTVATARAAIERATAAVEVESLEDFDSGAFGIPPLSVQSESSHGLEVVDGAITVTWKADGSELAGLTYTLSANGHLPPVQWSVGGSCVDRGFC